MEIHPTWHPAWVFSGHPISFSPGAPPPRRTPSRAETTPEMSATTVSRVTVAPRATLSGSRARARRSVAGPSDARRAHSIFGRRVVVRATAAEELPPTDWAREWRGAFSGDENGTLSEFMRAACERLSGVETRFIVIADSAILESVQPWPSEPRFAELGAKGTCCTLASPDKSFEAHIFLAKVRHVALARSERGGRKIYAVRFFGEAPEPAPDSPPQRPLLTAVLHSGADGEVPADAVEKWEALAECLSK